MKSKIIALPGGLRSYWNEESEQWVKSHCAGNDKLEAVLLEVWRLVEQGKVQQAAIVDDGTVAGLDDYYDMLVHAAAWLPIQAYPMAWYLSSYSSQHWDQTDALERAVWGETSTGFPRSDADAAQIWLNGLEAAEEGMPGAASKAGAAFLAQVKQDPEWQELASRLRKFNERLAALKKQHFEG